MGALFAHLAATATAALKRRLIAFGLWVASGLFLVFSAGYALNALYTLLMFRWDAVTASLAVAGGLLLGAVVFGLVGHLISRTPQRSLYQRLQASPEMSITAKRLAGPDARRRFASVAAGAVAGVVAVAILAKLRGASPGRSEKPNRRMLTG